MGPCCSPRQVPAPRDLQSKQLCRGVLPCHFAQGSRRGSHGVSCADVEWCDVGTQIQPSFVIESSEVMKMDVNYAPYTSYELTPVVLAVIIS